MNTDYVWISNFLNALTDKKEKMKSDEVRKTLKKLKQKRNSYKFSGIEGRK